MDFTINAWNVPEQYTDLIDSILKTKVFHNGHVYDNDTGTPQGGVISPMLANVALTGLDNFIEENFFTGYNTQRVNPIVRYADDFVITCVSKTKAVEIKKAVSQYLSENIGLTLSESKSKITHIKKGFNFLGFNVRKYLKHKNKHKPEKSIDDYVLLIKPQKVKIQGFLKEFSNVLTENKTATQSNLIHLLNPKVIGWANYYRYVVSSEIFSDIDDIIWEKVLRWANRRHSNKNKGWIMRKYFLRLTDTRDQTFRDKLTKTTLKRLYPILSKKRYTKNKGGMRVYSTENAEYWEKREYLKTLSQFFYKKGQHLFSKQLGICPYCKALINVRDVNNNEVHVHHMLPRSFKGTDSYSNLRLLHKECHVDLHSRFSRKLMADTIINKRLDYINAKDEIISDVLESRVR